MADTDDEALLAELAAALGPALRPPPELVEAAKRSFTWRTIDAELAELTFDSLLDDGPVATARSGAQPRILTFEAGRLAIEVEVDPAPAGRRLLGQLVPAQAAGLDLLGGAVPVSTAVDALGRFVLDLPARRQPIALRLRLADGSTVESSWITL